MACSHVVPEVWLSAIGMPACHQSLGLQHTDYSKQSRASLCKMNFTTCQLPGKIQFNFLGELRFAVMEIKVYRMFFVYCTFQSTLASFYLLE